MYHKIVICNCMPFLFVLFLCCFCVCFFNTTQKKEEERHGAIHADQVLLIILYINCMYT